MSEDDRQWTVNHGYAPGINWWTLDFANAFLSQDVNSPAELVPSPRAYARSAVGSGIKVTTALHAVTDKIKVPLFNEGKHLVDPIRYAS
jgi:hypothetical protein